MSDPTAAALARSSRLAQGLPATVTDHVALARVAQLLRALPVQDERKAA